MSTRATMLRPTAYVSMAALLLTMTLPPDADAGRRHKAHPPPPPKWEREPASFLSLPLGGALAQQRQCPPRSADAAGAGITPAPCWQGESNVKRFYHLPTPGFALDSVYAVMNDGRIGTVIVNGERAEYAAMKRYLIDSYGPPTRSAMTPMGQHGGMMLGVETLRWDGDTVAIRLEEIYNRVDMFRVVVLYKPSTLHTALLTN